MSCAVVVSYYTVQYNCLPRPGHWPGEPRPTRHRPGAGVKGVVEGERSPSIPACPAPPPLSASARLRTSTARELRAPSEACWTGGLGRVPWTPAFCHRRGSGGSVGERGGRAGGRPCGTPPPPLITPRLSRIVPPRGRCGARLQVVEGGSRGIGHSRPPPLSPYRVRERSRGWEAGGGSVNDGRGLLRRDRRTAAARREHRV